MELQTQLNMNCEQYFCNNEFGTNDENDTLLNDFQHSPGRMDGKFNPHCGSWMHSYSSSYAWDARIRLETLKSGSSAPVSPCTTSQSMYSYDFFQDIWELGQNELSALDSVDLIDVEEEEEEEEESWLYVSPKQFASGEKAGSALRWCRQVLDNRSPEMEAACLKLISRLNSQLSCESKHPRLQQTSTFPLDLLMDHSSFSRSSNSFDHTPTDSNYKLHTITDVYNVARTQEASLRQGNFHPARGPESPSTLTHCSNTTAANACVFSSGSSRASVPGTQSARTAEKNCLSPKVTRLHEYKMLKRAQNQGQWSGSPMRTSLRSLQAVRSSRSLDIDDYSLDKIFLPKPGLSPARPDSGQRSDEPVQSTVMRRCQRAHSLSPSRISHPSSSSADRGFSPENLRDALWLRRGRQLQINKR